MESQGTKILTIVQQLTRQIYPADRYHLMPVITPAYPSMCATHNITMSTKKVIVRELERGGDLVDKIFTGQLKWKDLFERHTFFTHGYKYYLEVVSTSRTKEAQLLWQGLVESKVRHLVGDLENDELIDLAHPFNEGFERVHRCQGEDQVDAVIRGDLRHQAKDIKTESTELDHDPKYAAAAHGEADGLVAPTPHSNEGVKDRKDTLLYTTTYYIGLELSQGRLCCLLFRESLLLTA